MNNIHFLSTPAELSFISHPPKTLYAQGSLKALELLKKLPERGLAVVGTRNPQPRSIDLVQKNIQALAQSNLIIVSGLARGIDSKAHEAALKVQLPTIAILGSGHDFTYPPEGITLRNMILKQDGLILSEFSPKTPPLRHHFLQRNRLIAGWSNATWVVEAGKQSGALNTARWAREFHKTCFAVPCYPGDPAFFGNQTLLDRDHALCWWGTHSLGSVWLELATHSLVTAEGIKKQEETTHLNKLLTKQAQALLCERGYIHIPDLFNWAMQQNWSPEIFFKTLNLTMTLDKEHLFPTIVSYVKKSTRDC